MVLRVILQDLGRGVSASCAADSLEQASTLVRAYIMERDLGSREWSAPRSGLVTDEEGQEVAKISYNGRVWSLLDGEEIPLP